MTLKCISTEFTKSSFNICFESFGGSFSTLTLFSKTVTGKVLAGMELRNSAKSSCTSAFGFERCLMSSFMVILKNDKKEHENQETPITNVIIKKFILADTS